MPAPAMLSVRPLAPEELEALAAPARTSAPSVQKIRDSHHAVARLIAQGLKHVEISQITGYSQTRISVLKNDPAFVELVEFYRLQQKEVFVGLQQRLAAVALDAAQELQQRLDENPEGLTPRELMEMVALAQPKGQPQAQGGGGGVQVTICFPEHTPPTAPTIDGEASLGMPLPIKEVQDV